MSRDNSVAGRQAISMGRVARVVGGDETRFRRLGARWCSLSVLAFREAPNLLLPIPSQSVLAGAFLVAEPSCRNRRPAPPPSSHLSNSVMQSEPPLIAGTLYEWDRVSIRFPSCERLRVQPGHQNHLPAIALGHYRIQLLPIVASTFVVAGSATCSSGRRHIAGLMGVVGEW